MPQVSTPPKTFWYGFFGFWLLNILLGLHGYSFPIWHEYLDGDKKSPEVIMGVVRNVRGDDSVLDLPLILSQIPNHFKVENPNIGFGQNMLAPMRTPTLTAVSFFRPSSWLFFIGPNIGLAWMWWFYVMGVFLVTYYLIRFTVPGIDWKYAALGGFIMVYSPFFRFWSFHKAEIYIHGLVTVFGLLGVVFSSQKIKIIAWGVLTGWAASSYILDHIYPPFQVTFAYALILLATYLIWERRKNLSKDLLPFRIYALLLSVCILFFAAYSFWKGAGDSLRLISQTVYPGTRFSTGGELSLINLLASHFFVSRYTHDWTFLGNVCESSGFIYFSPLIFILWILNALKKRKPISWPQLLFVLYTLFLLFYATLGIPEWLARVTLFYKTTSNRLVMALGLIEIVVLFSYLKSKEKYTQTDRRIALIAWLILLALGGISLKQNVSDLTWARYFYAIFVNFGLGALLIREKNNGYFLAILSLIYFSYTTSFNPLVYHGAEYITDLPLSKKIKDLDESKSRWIVFSDGNSPVDNYLRMIGVNGLGGYLCPPPFEMFKTLDPENTKINQFNQCGYFKFITSTNAEAHIKSIPGHIEISLSPDSPILNKLKVENIIAVGPDFRIFESSKILKMIYEYKNFRIYRQREKIN